MKRFLLLISIAGGQVHGQSQLTLRQAEATALQNHPRIQSAKLEAGAAREQTTQLRSTLYPSVFGNLTGAAAPEDTRIAAGGLNNPSIFSRFASGFTASQLITDFGRTGNLLASSRLRAAAESDRVDVAAAGVLLDVDRAFFEALRAQSVLFVAQQTVKDRQLVADQVTALAKSKLKSGLDVSFANVNLAQAKLLLASAQNDVDAAFATLSAAMGYDRPQRWELLDQPLPPAPPADFEALLATAIAKRPELAELRASTEAARRFSQAEKYLWLPTIGAVSSFGVVPDHNVNLPGRYAAAGLNITVPVFNGRLFSARHREAEFRAQAEDQRLRDERLRVARDLRLAWLQAQTAYQRIDLTAQLLQQADQALDLAQARYDIGLGSIVELSQAQLAQTSARIENVSARYDYQARRSTLLYEAGELP